MSTLRQHVGDPARSHRKGHGLCLCRRPLHTPVNDYGADVIANGIEAAACAVSVETPALRAQTPMR
jgi:hypothetical protein